MLRVGLRRFLSNVLTTFLSTGRSAALVCLVGMVGPPLFAQQSGSAPAPAAARETAPLGEARETDLTVSIAKVNGQPGNEVSVPVLFARKEGTANLAKLRLRLQYAGKVLQFARMEDAYMSRRVKMALQATESANAQPNPQGQRTLELNFNMPAGDRPAGDRPAGDAPASAANATPSAAPAASNGVSSTGPVPAPLAQFPSGQLATLFFNIAESAPEEIVRIPAEAWIDGQPVLPNSPIAKVEPGLISVTIEPVYLTCFFFTH